MTKPATTDTIPSIDNLLGSSQATDAFKDAVRGLVQTGSPKDRVVFSHGLPPVKVQRVIAQLLEAEPGARIDAVTVDGTSGCSDFRGLLNVRLAGGESRRYRFAWDCAWKAHQMGWKTFWGDPDQQRAAREFGYRCFEVFEEDAS